MTTTVSEQRKQGCRECQEDELHLFGCSLNAPNERYAPPTARSPVLDPQREVESQNKPPRRIHLARKEIYGIHLWIESSGTEGEAEYIRADLVTEKP